MNQQPFSVADLHAANILAYASNLSGGSFGGVNPPKYITGQTYLPAGFVLTGSTFVTAINDLFYLPFFVDKTQTFAGAKVYNQGAGDNGELIRLGVYADDGANGGPGTLIKDFGAIALTGASALRTAANAVTLTGPAWYWVAYAAQTAASMFGMSYMLTAVGALGNMTRTTGHTLSAAPSPSTIGLNASLGLYAVTAYGAMAATAVPPTSEISKNYIFGTMGTIPDVPFVGLYV